MQQSSAVSTQPPSGGGYSLFPNPSISIKPPSVRRPPSRTRRSESRERSRTRAVSPEFANTGSSIYPPPHGRQTPQQQRMQSPVERSSTPQEARQPPPGEQHQISPSNRELPALPPAAAAASSSSPSNQRPPAAVDTPPRSDTAFSQAQTLVRGNSNRSRSSIAKLPLPNETTSSQEQTALRSIFPQYNPEVPLNQQQYFPTQTSPTHIPRAVINRTTWYPEPEKEGREAQHRSPVRSPMSGGSTQRWPRRRVEPPVIPTVSTNEQMKNMWKVANGWKAAPSEGRVYCMKLSQEKDAPVYILSSTSQPFYSMRLDPTSASAYVTLSRHDPSKIYKAPSPTTSSSASSILSGVVGHHKDSGKGVENKNWQEVLTTTLEEESRKHPPNDGLVALLYPQAAAKMALEKPDDMNAVMTAETECARLVWDDDSSSHFLVHPALATPFCVTIERSPAWSRVEYTLEHHESPQHLAKLTRDGTGGGWLEIDTAIASKIDSFFIADVAVTALLLVAAADEKNAKVEKFEAPPVPRKPSDDGDGSDRRLSRREEKKKKKQRAAAAAARRGKMEEFEIDVESQDSSFAKLEQVGKETRDKLPWPLRALFKVVGGLFKCFIWALTLGVKALAALVKGLARCLGVKSK